MDQNTNPTPPADATASAGAQNPAATPADGTPPADAGTATNPPAAGTTASNDPLGAAAANAGKQPDGTDPLAAAAGNVKAAVPKSQAPEKYEAFKFGEQALSEDVTAQFAELAKKNGLSQEQAQEYMTVLAPAADKQVREMAENNRRIWLDQSQKDPEIGGEKFQENLSIAGMGYNQYASDGLKAVLSASGLSRHPEVIRLFYRLGKNLQQDKGVAGNATAPAPQKVYFPNSNMVRDLK